MLIHQQVDAARTGAEPALICKIPSGWVVLCNWQFLRGYCIQIPDPVVPSLNDLTGHAQTTYLHDMTMIGDALLEVTGAYRINYAIMGNSDQVLHSHIVPRYLNEPGLFRMSHPWSYPSEARDSVLFDYEHDRALILQIRDAIHKRLKQWNLER
jgi:diadenosine tetraphosphate (Ap4A) HIT family hydrolase